MQPRDAGLAVGDINGYMARFRPAPRASADKGHPDGPKLESRVKPRHCAGLMDNSLRTDDIEGTRWVVLLWWWLETCAAVLGCVCHLG